MIFTDDVRRHVMVVVCAQIRIEKLVDIGKNGRHAPESGDRALDVDEKNQTTVKTKHRQKSNFVQEKSKSMNNGVALIVFAADTYTHAHTRAAHIQDDRSTDGSSSRRHRRTSNIIHY